jgi:hypothetical protein
MRKLILFGVLPCLASCQTWGPTWSELSGRIYNITSIETGAIVITQIDGYAPNTVGGEPVKVTPGSHKLVLQAIPPGSVMGNIHYGEVTFDAKPCVRYYLNARFKTSTSPEWTPFIDYEEAVPGCQLPGAAPK